MNVHTSMDIDHATFIMGEKLGAHVLTENQLLGELLTRTVALQTDRRVTAFAPEHLGNFRRRATRRRFLVTPSVNFAAARVRSRVAMKPTARARSDDRSAALC
jgi:hypothetical protein